MNLERKLRRNGFDLIESQARNHKLFQIWEKTPSNPITEFREHVSELFESEVELATYENAALDINYENTINYKFNIGLTVLEELLSAINFGDLNLSANVEGGKEITVSFSDCKTEISPKGVVGEYIYQGDFRTTNPEGLRNLRNNNYIIITGLMYAKSIKIVIKTKTNINAELKAKLSGLLDGTLNYEFKSENELEMTSTLNDYMPIAVKACRIIWNNHKFVKLRPVSDNRDLY
jgi:hypothetical protein